MMGRGSDTRMYSPRSESAHMYSSANEDGDKYSPTSPEDADKRREEKQLKEEERKLRLKDIKHIKIKPSQGLNSGPSLPREEGLDDGNKRDDEREISLQGGPAGSRGHLLDMATGAKTGTGSAMGTGNSAVRTGEPMEDAWSSLLKEDEKPTLPPCPNCGHIDHDYDYNPGGLHYTSCPEPEEGGCGAHGEFNDNELAHILQHGTLSNYQKSEPMNDAWSTLLKSKPYQEMSEQELHDIVYGISGYDAGTGEYSQDETSSSQKEKELAFQELLTRQREAEANPVNVFGLNQEEQSRLVDFYEPQFSGTNISPDVFIPQNEKEGQAAYEFMEDGELGEHIENRLMDIDEFMPGKSFLSEHDPAQKYNHLLETAGRKVAENYLNRYRDFVMRNSENPEYITQRLLQMFDENQKITAPQYTQEFPTNESIFDIKPPHVAMNEPDATGFQHNWQAKNASEPMEDAWSTLLKRDTPKTIQARRRREARQQFRPSTGQFKKPPGGQSGGAGATMKRFKARMRGIKSGKRTGLMKPHLSVEMSHRGIATKQPMSKDPQKYRQYMGQQEAQKILGGVRNTFSPHARHSARSFTAGPTGGGRLTGLLPGQSGQMRQPSLRRLRRPRMPRIRPVMPPAPPMTPQIAPPMSSVPSMPSPSSSIMMSEERAESDILKRNRYARRTEMLELMRRLIDLQKKRNKLMKYVQGGGSRFEDGHVPSHPAGVQQNEDEDEKNDGPTQNLETNSSRLGLDPAGHLSGKRGHFG